MLRTIGTALAGQWRAGLIVVTVTLIWMAHFDRWTFASWNLPTDYYVDAHETLARLKAASEGDIVPLRPQVIERLGAPFGAHWNAYPTPDKPLMVALGGLVHAIGLFAAANIGFVLAQLTAALAFYFTARWLRCRWEWAAAGALLFAYTYHTFHRGLAHFSLAFTWTVPLGLLAVWLVAGSRRIAWRSPGIAVCFVGAVAIGVSNPYTLFFWLQLMGWALIFQAFGPRRLANLQIGAVTILVALGAFAIVHGEGWLYVEDEHALPLLARNYGGTERYALKLVEMFIPPPFHHWDAFAFFGHRYMRWSEWRGEIFLPYLGVAGIAGFIWLVIASIRRMIARRPLPGHALTLGWVIAYAMLGGLTNILALFAGFQIFRATNRAAIFVSAIVLIFLVVRLSRLSIRWPRGLRLGAAAALAALGVFEQIPEPDIDPAEIARMVDHDREFGAALEAALPPDAMVFQLPVLGFPEVATPHQLNDYEHIRPYLTTERLRFSYGGPKARARSRWQEELRDASVAELVPRLETAGFAALYLNRKGFADRGESILRELKKLGYAERIELPSGNQVAVKLRPAVMPRPPMSRSLTLGRGWHIQPDAGFRWAHAQGFISYFNPYPHRVRVDFEFTLQAVAPREVVLERDGELLRNLIVDTKPTVTRLAGFELLPGVNRFSLRSASPAIRLGQGPNQLRSFGLGESRVTLLPDSATVADRGDRGDVR